MAYLEFQVLPIMIEQHHQKKASGSTQLIGGGVVINMGSIQGLQSQKVSSSLNMARIERAPDSEACEPHCLLIGCASVRGKQRSRAVTHTSGMLSALRWCLHANNETAVVSADGSRVWTVWHSCSCHQPRHSKRSASLSFTLFYF